MSLANDLGCQGIPEYAGWIAAVSGGIYLLLRSTDRTCHIARGVLAVSGLVVSAALATASLFLLDRFYDGGESVEWLLYLPVILFGIPAAWSCYAIGALADLAPARRNWWRLGTTGMALALLLLYAGLGAYDALVTGAAFFPTMALGRDFLLAGSDRRPNEAGEPGAGAGGSLPAPAKAKRPGSSPGR